MVWSENCMVWSEIVWFQIMNLMVWAGSGVGQSAAAGVLATSSPGHQLPHKRRPEKMCLNCTQDCIISSLERSVRGHWGCGFPNVLKLLCILCCYDITLWTCLFLDEPTVTQYTLWMIVPYRSVVSGCWWLGPIQVPRHPPPTVSTRQEDCHVILYTVVPMRRHYV